MKKKPETIAEKIPDEVWKNIPFHDGYMISNFGRVKRLHRISQHPKSGYITLKEKIMLPYLTKVTGRSSGYLRITFLNGSIKTKIFIHRIVADAFCFGKSELRKFVNHKDGNKLNNHYLNLEWVTSKENFIHAVDLGLINMVQDNLRLTRTGELNLRY